MFQNSRLYNCFVIACTTKLVRCSFSFHCDTHNSSAEEAGLELPSNQLPWLTLAGLLAGAGYIMLNYPEHAPFPNEKPRGGRRSKGIAGLYLTEHTALKSATDDDAKYPLRFEGGHSSHGESISYLCMHH
jgi:hypothetical protein